MSAGFDPMYYNAIDQIYHVKWAAMKLARFELLRQSMSRLWPAGHPTKLIQVAGTSGKGSVCRFLEAGLSLSATSGSVISPHVFDYRERFSIRGQPVPRESIVEAWENRVRPLCVEQALESENHIHTYNEIYILLALCLFEKYGVEWAAVETGVGGRYDQTTALEVVAAVITNVGRDHEHLLGREQWQRALEKGGVCRRGKPLFSSVQDGEASSIIDALCRDAGAPISRIGAKDVGVVERALQDLYSGHLPEDTLLSSEHQLWNAALSLMIIKHFCPDLTTEAIVKAFVDVRFQGRFQKVEDGVYADVAHNPDKVSALVREVGNKFPDAGKVFVVGLAGMRSPQEVFPPILKVAKMIIVTTGFYRGQSAVTIKQELEAVNDRGIPIEVMADPREAFDRAKAIRAENDVIFLTGSTYMIDDALNPDPYLRHINATYGWRGQKGT